ncbi:MAG: beta-lactamase [Mucilaginibacter sp.]|nr:beta-lactamase [Mucilaginibacter sp.]
MIRKLFLFSTVFLLIVQSCSAQTFNKARLDSLMDALAANNKAMVSIALTQYGKPIYSKAVGYSLINSNQKIPATIQTHYRIGSITKVFTSVMVFQLIEEGKLQLTTPLAKFFPDLPNAGKITMANLLSHSSGLHNFTNDSSYVTIMERKVTEAEMLTKFKGQPSDFEPGSKTEYSNTNFVLLGYIVEKLDKKPYAIALKNRILNKIDLKDTYYGDKINPARQEAQSYKWDDSWKPATETDMSVPGGAGALVSTPTDLTHFMDALFTGKLVSDSSLVHMKTIKGGFGMDLMSMPFYEQAGYGHSGGIDGFASIAIYFPEKKLAFAYTANGANMVINDMAVGALSIALNRSYTLPTYTDKPFKLKPEDLDKYLGVYAAAGFPIKITITKNNAQLQAQGTGQHPFQLTATRTDEFSFGPAGIMLVFDPTKSQMTLKQGGKAYILTKEKQ